MRRTASGALSALAVLALGLVVALAASSVPGGAGDEPVLDLAWRPGVEIGSLLTWLLVIATLSGALILVLTAKQSSPRQGRKRNRVVVLILGVLVFALIARFMRSITDTLIPETSEVLGEVVDEPITEGAGNGIWMVSLLAAAVLTMALVRVGLAIRSGAPPVEDSASVEPIAPPAVSHSASRSYGDDPRGRVIGAYADFEAALEEVGIPRSSSETAARHVGRATAVLELSAPDVGTLSGRHADARFGPLDPTLDQAIEAESASARLRREIRQ